MASAPALGLPLFYSGLQPLSSAQHGDWKARTIDSAPFLAKTHAIPLTGEEFVFAQRHYPIVFTGDATPTPIALMGLNEGVNTFVDDDGRLLGDAYVPAYVRRYPFLLARLRPDADELSLCFDPAAGAIGPFDEGLPLFEDGQPSANTRQILGFCEQFEQAGQLTGRFVAELLEHKLLIDGEFTIQPTDAAQPYVYRGFRFVSEEALRNLRGDVARKMIQSGAMALIHAHIFSLSLARDIFARQVQQGKQPALQLLPA